MNSIKVIFALFVTSFTLQAQSNSTLAEVRASSFEGYSAFSENSPTDCLYSVEVQVNRGGEQVVIYLNSDNESMINAAIRLSPDQVPLKEGTLISRRGVVVKYENGILTQTKKETDEGPFTNDYQVLKLAVNAKLTKISSAYTKSVTKGLIRERVLNEMSCRF